jgi:hypothetical protein
MVAIAACRYVLLIVTEVPCVLDFDVNTMMQQAASAAEAEIHTRRCGCDWWQLIEHLQAMRPRASGTLACEG